MLPALGCTGCLGARSWRPCYARAAAVVPVARSRLRLSDPATQGLRTPCLHVSARPPPPALAAPALPCPPAPVPCLLQDRSKPVGLKNLGNTCYVNSVLQVGPLGHTRCGRLPGALSRQGRCICRVGWPTAPLPPLLAGHACARTSVCCPARLPPPAAVPLCQRGLPARCVRCAAAAGGRADCEGAAVRRLPAFVVCPPFSGR